MHTQKGKGENLMTVLRLTLSLPSFYNKIHYFYYFSLKQKTEKKKAIKEGGIMEGVDF